MVDLTNMTPREKLEYYEYLELKERQAASIKDSPELTVTSKPKQNYFLETLGNVPSSALQYGKDLIQPFMDPKGTYEGMSKLAGSMFHKYDPAGIYNEDSAGLQAERASEADAVGAYLKDRFINNPAEHFKNDPVGMLSDVGGILTGGSSILSKTAKLGKLNKVANVLDKVADKTSLMDAATLATNVPSFARSMLPVDKTKIARSIREEAALPVPKKGGIAKSVENAETMAKYKITPTYKGAGKLDELIKSKISERDALLSGVDVDISGGTDTLIDAYMNPSYTGASTSPGMKNINAKKNKKQIKSMMNQWSKTFGNDSDMIVDGLVAQDLKQQYMNQADYVKASKKRSIKNEVSREVGSALKEAIELEVPEVGKLNNEIQSLMDLKQPLNKATGRLTKSPSMSWRSMLYSGLAGYAHPIAGGLMVGYALHNTPQRKLRRLINQYNRTPKLEGNVPLASIDAILRNLYTEDELERIRNMNQNR